PQRPLRSPVTQAWLKYRRMPYAAILALSLALSSPIVGVLLLITRCFEISEGRRPVPGRRYPENPHAREFLNEALNVGEQNHMCTLATVRSSRFRRFMAKLGLSLTRVLAGKIVVEGKLDAMTTIHFARWTFI